MENGIFFDEDDYELLPKEIREINLLERRLVENEKEIRTNIKEIRSY